MITVKPMTDNPTVKAGLKVPTTNTRKSEQKFVKPKVWAVDFDGTLCKNRYPSIGAPNMELIEALRYARESGVKLILWTSREDEALMEAVNACKLWGLEFDAYNENLPEMIAYYGHDPRKIGADMYIDDRAFPWWGEGEKGDLCKLTQNSLPIT